MLRALRQPEPKQWEVPLSGAIENTQLNLLRCSRILSCWHFLQVRQKSLPKIRAKFHIFFYPKHDIGLRNLSLFATAHERNECGQKAGVS